MNWQLQEAKARLSELIKTAQTDGAQHITLRGTPTAVVLSEAEYEKLAGTNQTLVQFMRRSPLYGDEDIDFLRDRSLTREVEF